MPASVKRAIVIEFGVVLLSGVILALLLRSAPAPWFLLLPLVVMLAAACAIPFTFGSFWAKCDERVRSLARFFFVTFFGVQLAGRALSELYGTTAAKDLTGAAKVLAIMTALAILLFYLGLVLRLVSDRRALNRE